MTVRYILENAILCVLVVMDQDLLLARCAYHTPAVMETEFVHVMTSGKGQPAKAMLVTAIHVAMAALGQRIQIV